MTSSSWDMGRKHLCTKFSYKVSVVLIDDVASDILAKPKHSVSALAIMFCINLDTECDVTG